MLTDLFADLKKELPSSLSSVPVATSTGGIDSCVRLARTWRNSRDVRDIGTGFVIDSGVVVTNAHVTATCDQNNLVGISPSNDRVAFSKVIKDQNRDLAVLIPTKKLSGGFKLADADDPAPGTAVSTWGYPFAYNGVSPLLSVGYVSGYRTVPSGGLRVKHIVVNGAFNHGNSGGPLLISQHDEVVGIVVLTYNFYPAEVKQIIDALTAQRSGFMMGSITKADGTKESITTVLQNFKSSTMNDLLGQ